MSILNVEHLTHGFGDRAIFNDVSFRLLKGERHRTDRCEWRRQVHLYEYYYRKADAG